ncbi:MAG: DUF397 domain-containing protein [Pseudonocardiales bacterium]|nr:DUF397 domain-containing protein [Pseudonocardiales bacterium]
MTRSTWRTSSYSSDQGGNCLEVADLPNDCQAVRDSKDPDGPALAFTPAAWSAFTASVRAGQFD